MNLKSTKIVDNRRLTDQKKRDYRQAGYTHYISFLAPSKNFNLIYKEGFPTTSDAIKHHAKAIEKRGGEAKIIKL